MRRLPLAAIVAGLALASLILLTGPASAHAELESSDPGNGQLLETAPDHISLTFTEPPDVGLTTIGVVDASGAGVDGADVRIESTDITERTDKYGRFCLASPTRKLTLLVGASGRDSVRYAVELEGRNTQVSVTLR